MESRIFGKARHFIKPLLGFGRAALLAIGIDCIAVAVEPPLNKDWQPADAHTLQKRPNSASSRIPPAALIGTWRYQGLSDLIDITGAPTTDRRLFKPDSVWETPVDTGFSNRNIGYRFAANQTYEFDYEAAETSGMCISKHQITETGRYTFDGQQLRLRPQQHQGYIQICHPSNRQSIHVKRSGARSYRVFAQRGSSDRLILQGYCAPFMTDKYCFSKDKPKNRKIVHVQFGRWD